MHLAKQRTLKPISDDPIPKRTTLASSDGCRDASIETFYKTKRTEKTHSHAHAQSTTIYTREN